MISLSLGDKSNKLMLGTQKLLKFLATSDSLASALFSANLMRSKIGKKDEDELLKQKQRFCKLVHFLERMYIVL